MRGNCCLFIGHRDTDEKIYPDLMAEVERHIEEYGVNDFVLGHYVAFDRRASRVVIEEKRGLIRVTNLAGWYPEV